MQISPQLQVYKLKFFHSRFQASDVGRLLQMTEKCKKTRVDDLFTKQNYNKVTCCKYTRGLQNNIKTQTPTTTKQNKFLRVTFLRSTQKQKWKWTNIEMLNFDLKNTILLLTAFYFLKLRKKFVFCFSFLLLISLLPKKLLLL